MINIVSSIALLVISVSQLNIFEIDGVFSSAHVRSTGNPGRQAIGSWARQV